MTEAAQAECLFVATLQDKHKEARAKRTSSKGADSGFRADRIYDRAKDKDIYCKTYTLYSTDHLLVGSVGSGREKVRGQADSCRFVDEAGWAPEPRKT